MDRIKRLSLTSEKVLGEFKNAIAANDPEKVVEMLEELLGRGEYYRKILDAVYVKIEVGCISVHSTICNIIANTISHGTRNYLADGHDGDRQNLRLFAEVIKEPKTTKDNVVEWYRKYFYPIYASSK